MGRPLDNQETERGLSLVVVGCGRRLHALLPALQRNGSEIVALVDSVEAATRMTAMDLGSAAPNLIVADFTPDTLRGINADAVVITSPSGLHFPHSVTSLEAGIRTFVEKPLACTSEQARYLMAVAASKLTVSEQRVHRADLVLVKQMMQSGHIGEIIRVRYCDTIRPMPSFGSTWRNDPALAGGGVLFDLGYHTINTLQWLFDVDHDSLKPIAAVLRFGQLRVEDFASVSLSYREVKISVETALVTRSPNEFLEIVGSKAALTLRRFRENGTRSTIQIVQHGKTREIVCDLGTDYDSHSLTAFLEFHTSAASLSRHVETVVILEQVYDIATKSS
jgi:predicted dehydrogenase